MRTMYDSDNLDDIPAEAEIVAFYCDGEPGTPTETQLSRFAGRPLVGITRKVGVKGKVADVEPGAIWPPDTARAHFEAGNSDTVYTSWGSLQEVLDALNGLHYDLWVAQWDQNAELPVIPNVNVVAKQYAAPMHGSPGHYDLSVVSDSWPTVAEPVKENPVSDIHPEEDTTPVEAADGHTKLAAPIVDAVAVAGGVYMVGADGGVFCRDAAVFHGNLVGTKLNADICAIVVTDHTGYTLIGEDGGTFRFGNGPEVQPL